MTGRGAALKALKAQLQSASAVKAPLQQSPDDAQNNNPESVVAGALPKPAPRVPTGRAAALLAKKEALKSSAGSRGAAVLGQQAEVVNKPSTSSTEISPKTMSSPRSTGTDDLPIAEALKSLRVENAKFNQYEAMPDRQTGTAGTPLDIVANYLRLTPIARTSIFSYHVHFSPPIDSKQLRFKLLKSHQELLGVNYFNGMELVVQKRAQYTELESVIEEDSTKVRITLQLTGEREEMDEGHYARLMTKAMASLDLVNLGKQSYYNPNQKIVMPKHNLEMWPGYETSVRRYEDGLFVVVDISYRVLRTSTVLEYLRGAASRNPNSFKRDALEFVIGLTVLTRYNNKRYKVDDIAWDENPGQVHPELGVSLCEYYKNRHGVTITDPKQPLLIHKAKRRVPGSDEPVEQLIALVPELCNFCGLTDDIRADTFLMRELATISRQVPEVRVSEINKLANDLRTHPIASKILADWNIRVSAEGCDVRGRRLAVVEITTGKSHGHQGHVSHRDYAPGDFSREVTKNALIEPVCIDKWLLLYPTRDQSVALGFAECLNMVAKSLNLKMGQAIHEVLRSDNTKDYIAALDKNVESQYEFVVFIVPSQREDRYAAIKKYLTVEKGKLSQCILTKTIRDPKKLRSCVQKIAIQMASKCGGIPWAIRIPAQGLMTVGIDVYHDNTGNNSVAGLVASVNGDQTQYSHCTAKKMRGEELCSTMKTQFIQQLLLYKQTTGALPQTIVLFRDGVGHGQLNVVREFELPQLLQAFTSFTDYKPHFSCVIVQKRISTKLFARNGAAFCNPAPGTVVDTAITESQFWDYYIVSQSVRQGTVSPTRYIVIQHDSKFSADALQSLTYRMTHMYYNWPGTIRVPAVTQLAHKLAYQQGQILQKDAHPALTTKPFYL